MTRTTPSTSPPGGLDHHPRPAERVSSVSEVYPGHGPVAGPRPTRTILALYTRLVRRPTLLIALALAAYGWLEVASYASAYPEGISPVQFAMFEDNPAVRMMNGVPEALDQAGGFAVWDAGWIWQLVLGIWAILTTTRFLRAEEDAGRADLVLASRIRPTRMTGLVLVVMCGALLLAASALSISMAASGEDARASVLTGIVLAGVGATFAGVAAVASQLVEVRRRAAGLAAAVVGVAYVLRMVGSSADGREWVRWFTPLGWLDELRPFGATNTLALVPALVVPLLFCAAAVALRAHRDTGSALLVADSSRRARTHLLSSPIAFAWRSNWAVLLAWVLGLGAYAAVMGGLVSTMIDWIAGDEGYQRILAEFGLDQAVTIDGFLAMIGLILGVAVALQITWRIGAARAEEESGRLEALLARPVSRVRWLGGHIALAMLGGAVLLIVLGAALWLGAAAAGSDEIVVADTLRAVMNTLPVVLLVGGLCVLCFGLIPRLTVALPAALTVVWFVLSMLGPALSWPAWVVNASPFTHLAMVPAEPWAATAGWVMVGLGVAMAVAGLLTFHRRDVVAS